MEGCMSSMFGNKEIELSKGLKQLYDEHPPLRSQMDDLLELCKQLETTENTHEQFPHLIDKVSTFFQQLEAHSEREEGVLFPMLETYLGKSGGPIAVMEYEHDQAKKYISTFLKKTAEAASEEEMVLHSLLIKDACHLLIDHFAKEENVLFPMGENLLSDEEKEELYKRINE